MKERKVTMLKTIEFMIKNENWRELLSQKPYGLEIKDDGDYTLLKYNPLESDYSNPVVQECRGLIIKTVTKTLSCTYCEGMGDDEQYFCVWCSCEGGNGTYKRIEYVPVCVPFYKFFNVQEQFVHPIDWSTAKVQEKIDGSLIKVWDGHISTSGTIDAFKAETGSALYPTFGDLFICALAGDFDTEQAMEIIGSLDDKYTYMFEVVSPHIKNVVPYEKTDVYFLGARNMETMQEEDLDIGIQKPKTYSLSTLEECLASANALPFSEEGYVVVDANYNRVKIKSPAYVAAHHIRNNGVITYRRIFKMLRLGEDDDFLSYFPEYGDSFDKVRKAFSNYVDELCSAYDLYLELKKTCETKKDYAMIVKTHKHFAFLFALWDVNTNSVNHWIDNMLEEKLFQLLHLE
jgi:hypothetical protein